MIPSLVLDVGSDICVEWVLHLLLVEHQVVEPILHLGGLGGDRLARGTVGGQRHRRGGGGCGAEAAGVADLGLECGLHLLLLDSAEGLEPLDLGLVLVNLVPEQYKVSYATDGWESLKTCLTCSTGGTCSGGTW